MVLERELTGHDRKVIDAALRLGDWILARPEATDEQRDVIRETQEKLRLLPIISLYLLLDFEVTFRLGDSKFRPGEEADSHTYCAGIGGHTLNRWSFDLFANFFEDRHPDRTPNSASELAREFSYQMTVARHTYDDGRLDKFIAEIDQLSDYAKTAKSIEIEVSKFQVPEALRVD